ncbi:MAG: EF-P lysine aminoacylase GenX [Gammaproteobacteria bacterium]|nr:EF-P lysine aminoacylase GenX [Gammaproteobacteria bacterium]
MTPDAVRWRPSATQKVLQQRAQARAAVREFFAARAIMEVETPLVVEHPVSEPQLASVCCTLSVRPEKNFYLHTSPEFHMKRLLADGAPDIYQVCKAFRDGELGARHLPEFTLVEWYRRGIGLDAMIDETCELILAVAETLGRGVGVARRQTYRGLFLELAGFDPITGDMQVLRERTEALLAGRVTPELTRGLGDQRNSWLDLLMISVIEPALRGRGLTVIEGYPVEQAALARRDPNDPAIAERFEVYLDGLELANGYHELADPREQRRRFERDRALRRQTGLLDVGPDEALLAALESGLPGCCGVALGFDRLLMAVLGLPRISDVVSFCVPPPP